MKRTIVICLLLTALLSLAACGAQPQPSPAPQEAEQSPAPAEAAEPDGEEPAPDAQSEPAEEVPAESEDPPEERAPVLLYMGHASLRIVTPEDKVIYIDPYAGDGYDLPADLILVTHDHFDHSALKLVGERSGDCRVITRKEALEGGEHRSFELPFVSVEAVEAGNNRYHDVRSCVGYVLRFPSGVSLYVSGDSSETAQMAEMADMQLDYAFFCCDGVYNMGPEEAARCAGLVGAKHNIPYHTASTDNGSLFDTAQAERFDAPGRLIVSPGEEIGLR